MRPVPEELKLKPKTTEPEPPVLPETPVVIPWETIPLRELPAKVSPMLLSVYSKAIWTHQSELLVSEKYDGWRVYYRNGVFHTRSGKRIPVPARFYEILAPFRHLDFDGELWLGYGTMSSAGRDDETPSNKDGLEREHRSPERAPQAREGQTLVSLDDMEGKTFGTSASIIGGLTREDLRFKVFDLPNVNLPYMARYTLLQLIFHLILQKTPDSPIQLVEQKVCKSHSEVQTFFQEVIDRRGEGAVVRPLDVGYQMGIRHPYVMKLKEHNSIDATVVDYFLSERGLETRERLETTTGVGGDNGFVSSLVCRTLESAETKEGIIFKVSFRGTHPPPIGSVITVRFSQWSPYGLPKFPVFVCIRDSSDMSEPKKEVEPITRTVAKKPAKERVVEYMSEKKDYYLSAPNCRGLIKATEYRKGETPVELNPGEFLFWENEKGTWYKIMRAKRIDSVYCSCDAWKYQRLAPALRSCKHIRAIF
jgi:DNA ligase-1